MVENTPKLAVAITHYLQLIKQLTHQDISMETKEEIISAIVENPQSFNSAETVAAHIFSARKRLLKSVGDILVEKIKTIPGVTDAIISDDFGTQYQGIEIFTEDKKDPKNRPAHLRLSFLRDCANCYFEIHPGLKDAKALPKNKVKWKMYIDNLNGHFGKSKGNIFNTEVSWQGEWVMEYFVLRDRFNDIISDKNRIVNEVLIDVNIVMKYFLEVQRSKF